MSNQQMLDDLAHIRRIMSRSSRFLSLSGYAGIVSGIFALLGAAWAYHILDYGSRFYDREMSLADGISHTTQMLLLNACIVIVLSLAAAYYFTYKKARKYNYKMWDKAAQRMMIDFITPMIVGGVLCLLLLFQYGFYELIAPMTLIFYGLGLINAAKHSIESIKILGYCEIILGLIALFFPLKGLLFWAIGFGILHIIYGAYMLRKENEDEPV